MSAIALQIGAGGPPPVFRLFGLVFAVLGLVNVLRPRAMTSYRIRRRTRGEVEGQIEPTPARLLFTRVVGGLMIVVGLALAAGTVGF